MSFAKRHLRKQIHQGPIDSVERKELLKKIPEHQAALEAEQKKNEELVKEYNALREQVIKLQGGSNA